MKRLYTSESVRAGHPDKVCDQISDAILDAILEKDPLGRVACETMIGRDILMISGEITTSSYVPVQDIARKVINKIGYNREGSGFNIDKSSFIVAINEQSPDISRAVTGDKTLGAGDQGMMFGYATDEDPRFMPLPLMISHDICRAVDEKMGELDWLLPDGKAQVTMEYVDDKPTRIDTVVLSVQHTEDTSLSEVRDAMIDILSDVLPIEYVYATTKFHINPSGRFVTGGPEGDTGLTGRKIIVDTYGSFAPHGGGAFSGKDPTKVDRSGAYIARLAALEVVRRGYAKRCRVALSYAIGVAEPVSVDIETFGTATGYVGDEELYHLLPDFTPSGIIKGLDLRRPIYQQTATYGHFGRLGLNLPWEGL